MAKSDKRGRSHAQSLSPYRRNRRPPIFGQPAAPYPARDQADACADQNMVSTVAARSADGTGWYRFLDGLLRLFLRGAYFSELNAAFSAR